MNGAASAAAVVRGAAAHGYYALRLGATTGPDVTTIVDHVDGGDVYADVIAEAAAGSHFLKKHLGSPKYSDVVLGIGLAMPKELFTWIAGSWGAQPQKQDGALVAVDWNYNVKAETEFGAALITEVTVPKLDAASKETGALAVRLQPESIARHAGSGKLSLAHSKQKMWRTSNFRLQIDDLDCTHVMTIDSFTVTREVTVATNASGDVTLVAGRTVFPGLTITLSQASATSWFDWHKSFVVNGNNGDEFERSGSLSFLSVDLKTTLSRIDFHHLGIVRLAPVAGETGKIARLAAELYCEEMVLS